MNFVQSIKTCFRKYFDFKGRATRSEFWWFQLFTLLIFGFTSLADTWLGYELFAENTPITTAGELLVLLPTLAVTSRRLHDIGWSGWLQAPIILIYLTYLDFLVPGFSENVVFEYVFNIAGLYWVIILLVCIKRGEAKFNKYGPNPKSPEMSEVFS